ncbi:hypothetical protein FSP39_001028 [Pinctada imbricata]|uniref:Receptor ligand binding region domain-containing protein n=1 Tax=Pinctada imbricata TaxID=66713 RepID=A0AA88XRF1_PINIB|nr:hypothetical protein FSP39_001028 [Pinctada imbricata]
MGLDARLPLYSSFQIYIAVYIYYSGMVTNNVFVITPGLLGPEYSSEAIGTSRIINTLPKKDQLLQIPFSSTADSLSNREAFRNIKRSIPVDRIQQEVMVSHLKKLEWNYVAVVYEDSDYGKESFAEFRSYASKSDICIPFHSKLSFGSLGELDPSEINVILRDITQHVESPISGVVFFGSSKSIQLILSSTDTLRGQYSFRLLFVLSSFVHMEEDYFKKDGNVMKAARGVYIVSPPKITYSGFTEHWRTILNDPAKVVNESSTNSWLKQLYYDIHTCNTNTDIMNCMPSVSGEKQAKYESIYTPYAIEAILIFAKLMKKMHAVYCKNETGLCSNMKNVLTENRGELVQISDDFVLNIDRDFPSLQVNISITFQNATDAIKHGTISDYEVFQYRKCTTDSLEFCFPKRLASSTSFDQDLWTPFAQNAMLSLLGGCSQAFVKLCGPQFQGICADYRAKVGEVVDEIKKEELVIDDSGLEKRVFSANGDGNVGYRIYQVQKMVNNPLKTEYVQVGRSTLDENGFTFEKHRLSFPYGGVPSKCPNTRACSHCFTSDNISTVKPQDQSKEDCTPVVAGMGAVIAILSIALITFIVMFIWNHRSSNGKYQLKEICM